MKTKVFNKGRLVLIMLLLLAICITERILIKPSYAEEVQTQLDIQCTLLSEMTEDECIEFIVEKGVEIPDEFKNSPALGSLVKEIIQIVEEDPNADFNFISYYPTVNFAANIKNAVNEYYAINQSSEVNSNSALSAYTLRDSTLYRKWEDDFKNYNCYTYAIGYREYDYNLDRYRKPGQMSGGVYKQTLPIEQMAQLVKDDLEAIGGIVVEVSSVRPIYIEPNQNLICIRKGDSSYHFMKYHRDGNFWTHKPGPSAILKYNGQPSNDEVWINESINEDGVAFKDSVTFTSTIYYITYIYNGLKIEDNIVKSFVPLMDFNGYLEIPDGVKGIDNGVFDWINALKEIQLPDSLISIGDYAFTASGLTSITIPSSVTNIGVGAFGSCENLRSITFEQNCKIKIIGDSAFIGSGLKSIEIPSSVVYINDYAFSNCEDLIEVTCYGNLNEIGQYAFNGCFALDSVTLPDSLERIDDYAFNACKNLTTINLGINNKLKYIGNCAFSSTHLTSFIYSNTVQYIGSRAFENSWINQVIISASTTDIGDYAFYNCPYLKEVIFGNETNSFGNGTNSLKIGTSAFSHVRLKIL
ncbi:MAG: leucine-rich repeat domain-containing protein [Clostridiales bacterium]|nr:leucine-rich repeat domain-containing protein [Clostridiales bacterium]